MLSEPTSEGPAASGPACVDPGVSPLLPTRLARLRSSIDTGQYLVDLDQLATKLVDGDVIVSGAASRPSR